MPVERPGLRAELAASWRAWARARATGELRKTRPITIGQGDSGSSSLGGPRNRLIISLLSGLNGETRSLSGRHRARAFVFAGLGRGSGGGARRGELFHLVACSELEASESGRRLIKRAH